MHTPAPWSVGEQRPFPLWLESTWHAGQVAGSLGELLAHPSPFPHESGMEAGCLWAPLPALRQNRWPREEVMPG